MKYLKTFESESFDFDIDLVKDIIVELKDNYPDINGEFQLIGRMINLKLLCSTGVETSIIGRYKFGDIDYIKEKNRFIQLLVDVCDRIKDALNRKVSITGLYDFDDDGSDGCINIYIREK